MRDLLFSSTTNIVVITFTSVNHVCSLRLPAKFDGSLFNNSITNTVNALPVIQPA